MNRAGWIVTLVLLLFQGLSQAGDVPEPLRVGVKEAPPFAMMNVNGDWTGLSIDLWEQIAADRGWETRWVPLQTARAQVDSLADGSIDIAVGALSMTPERELRMDFSHPFYSTGLAIASLVQENGWLALLVQLASPAFLSAVGVLALLLLGVGAALWLVEHKRNPQFGGSLAKGIGNGFWWSAVTMTTVGYGDKAPITHTGRVLATVWMFVSVITISSFTAAIASSVTLNQMRTAVGSVDDLGRVRTLVVDGSTGEQALLQRGVRAEKVASPDIALERMATGTADALVYDRAILQYMLRGGSDSIELLDYSGRQQEYALGMRPGLDIREQVNLSILEVMRTERWQRILTNYFGDNL